MKKIVRSIHYALKGLYHAYHGDKSFRMEVKYGLPIFLIVAWFLAPFQPWELLFYTLAYLIILIVELINTAFEKMLERVHPDEHEMIGRSKDISAAAVLVSLIFACVVVFVLVYTRLFYQAPFALGSFIV